jgi:hypothetical protein
MWKAKAWVVFPFLSCGEQVLAVIFARQLKRNLLVISRVTIGSENVDLDQLWGIGAPGCYGCYFRVYAPLQLQNRLGEYFFIAWLNMVAWLLHIYSDRAARNPNQLIISISNQTLGLKKGAATVPQPKGRSIACPSILQKYLVLALWWRPQLNLVVLAPSPWDAARPRAAAPSHCNN